MPSDVALLVPHLTVTVGTKLNAEIESLSGPWSSLLVEDDLVSMQVSLAGTLSRDEAITAVRTLRTALVAWERSVARSR